MNKKNILLSAFLLLFGGIASAQQIHLPSIFTDGMVMQQNSETEIWGWGAAGETVRILPSWLPNDTIKVEVNNQGKWNTVLKTIKAGGPYSMKIVNNDNSQIVLVKQIMMGEVWLCSGQSNMEWGVNNGILNGEEEAAKADYANLRIFQLPKQGANNPQDNVNTCWQVSSPSSMRKASAIGYFFGRYLSEKMNVPVGIIVSAWGGSPAEVWTPQNAIAKDSVLSNCKLTEYKWWPNKPGVLYNNMIHPFVPFRIAGCIWYQGESNHENATSYGKLMEAMIGSWRANFKNEFPFFFVQIAPYSYNSKHNTPAMLREQQEWVASNVLKTGMINVSDVVDDRNNIHPRDKRSVGERLGNLALDKVYGMKTRNYLSPTYDKVELKKGKAIVSFKQLNGQLICKGKTIIGIVACSDDNKWQMAKTKIMGDKLIVSLPKGINVKAVRYCFDDNTIGNLCSSEGMPILPFRSDCLSE